jgi:hypothetical protein
LNYPPPDRTVARRSSLSKYRRTYESQQTVITAQPVTSITCPSGGSATTIGA